MPESGDRNGQPPRKAERDDTTLRDGDLTNTLAQRLRREVELERANQAALRDLEAPDSPVPVVVGTDGVPRVADEVELIPESAIIEVEEALTPPRKPPPLPPPRQR